MKKVDTNGSVKIRDGGVVMERLPRGKYSREFRLEAVKLAIEGMLSAKEVGRRLNVSDNTINNWVRAYRQGKLSEVGKNQKPLNETELELARLRRELAQVKMERDILKKAIAYFARESQEGTR